MTIFIYLAQIAKRISMTRFRGIISRFNTFLLFCVSRVPRHSNSPPRYSLQHSWRSLRPPVSSSATRSPLAKVHRFARPTRNTLWLNTKYNTHKG